MAIEKTIKINIDTGNAEENLENINEGVEELGDSAEQTAKDTKKLADAFTGMGMVWKNLKERAINFVIDGVTEAMMNNQRVADRLNATNESVKILFNDVAIATVNVVERIIQAGISFEALGKVAKASMKLNMVPIKTLFILIKAAVIALQLAWEQSFFNWGRRDKEKIAELQQSLKQTAIDLKDTGVEAFEAGKDLVENYGGMLEEFQQLGEIIGEEFSGVITYSTEELKEMGEEIVQLQNEVKIAEAEQRQLQLQSQKDAEVQRQIRDDIRKSIDERIEANDELGRVLEEQFEREKAQMQKRVELAQKKKDADSENIDLQVELINAKTELVDLEERITGQQSEQRTNEAALQDEKLSNLQELSSIGKSEAEEARNALEIEAENRRQLAQRTISNEQELADTILAIEEDLQRKLRLLGAEEQAQKDEQNQKELEATKKLADEKQALRDANYQTVRGALGQIGGLVDKESKKGKAVAKALAIIDTFAGANKALAQGGIMGVVAAAGIIATGIANVKAITAQKLPGGDDDDSGTPTPSGIGGIGGGLIPNMEAIQPAPLGEVQPVQAYVVENDISNAQALQEELDIQATL
jgi:hypothetical protein|tara:strand:+ start:5186 stop:6949 length:1764 start_codon:yes stop_codon:yes gene_type:complete